MKYVSVLSKGEEEGEIGEWGSSVYLCLSVRGSTGNEIYLCVCVMVEEEGEIGEW